MVRWPAVAGRFYPAHPGELTDDLRTYLESAAERIPGVGIVAPHAGYMYSGHVAGAVYSRIRIPALSIVLCPNHTGYGPQLSIMKSGAWQTPLGALEIDEDICNALMAADPNLENDTTAHRLEHAIEVQLPFLQHIAGAGVRIAPITVGTGDWNQLTRLGEAIASVVSSIDGGALIIASSDMNHYESDRITRLKDRKAIDRILAIDPKGLYEVVERENISMCGCGPATAMLTAARRLGASNAELVKYATSADVNGDVDYGVGYAGMAVW